MKNDMVVREVMTTPDDSFNPMGKAIFYQLAAYVGMLKRNGEKFRAAHLESEVITSPVTGNWRYTQIYVGQPGTEFDLHATRSVMVAENAALRQIGLTYVRNDQDHVTAGTKYLDFLDVGKVAQMVAFFLENGKPLDSSGDEEQSWL
jgi:hypothetical protein